MSIASERYNQAFQQEAARYEYAEAAQKREADFATQVVGGTPVEEYPNYDIASRLVTAEAELAGITPDDNVLFIGSGPFPSSAICLARQYDASVTCYDTDSVACESSSAVFKKIGMEDKLKAVNASGESGPVEDFSVIVVALEVMPKQDVLQNILNHAQPGVKVIMRSSEGQRQSLFPALRPGNPAFGINGEGFHPVGSTVKQPEFDVVSTLYVRPSVNGKINTKPIGKV